MTELSKLTVSRARRIVGSIPPVLITMYQRKGIVDDEYLTRILSQIFFGTIKEQRGGKPIVYFIIFWVSVIITLIFTALVEKIFGVQLVDELKDFLFLAGPVFFTFSTFIFLMRKRELEDSILRPYHECLFHCSMLLDIKPFRKAIRSMSKVNGRLSDCPAEALTTVVDRIMRNKALEILKFENLSEEARAKVVRGEFNLWYDHFKPFGLVKPKAQYFNTAPSLSNVL